MGASAETHARKARERREKILIAIGDLWEEKGMGPTREEVAERVGLTSRTVSTAVKILREEGLLEPADRHGLLRPAP